MQGASRFPLLALLLCLPSGAAPARGDANWEFGAAVSCRVGDYGGAADETEFYLPFTLKRFFPRGDLALTVPALDVQSDYPDGASESGVGLGDAVLRGRCYAVAQKGPWPYVDVVGRMKAPTADESEGLGTGEPDFGAGVEVSRWLGFSRFVFLDLLYNFIGDPPDMEYDDQRVASLGIGWQASPRLQASISYDYSSAIDPADEAARSIGIAISGRIERALRVYGVVEAGLSDGAPDLAWTIGSAVRF